MYLDTLLCNVDRSSKHIVLYDKQMYQIILQIAINATKSVTLFSVLLVSQSPN